MASAEKRVIDEGHESVPSAPQYITFLRICRHALPTVIPRILVHPNLSFRTPLPNITFVRTWPTLSTQTDNCFVLHTHSEHSHNTFVLAYAGGIYLKQEFFLNQSIYWNIQLKYFRTTYENRTKFSCSSTRPKPTKIQSFISTTMTQPTYDRDAAIREVLTVIEAATIDPEKRRCGICWEQMEDPVEASAEASTQESPPVKLPCPHTYHQECITRWLETSPTCPTCRAQILPFATEGPNLDLQTWQRSRERYLRRLSDRYLGGLGPRAAHDDVASEAYLFLTAITDADEVPDPDIQYIADAVSNIPEYLTLTRRFRSARYYDDCSHRRERMDYETLARLIREDLDEIEYD